MNTLTRVAAFVGGLAAIFAAAVGVGILTGPIGTADLPNNPAATAPPAQPSASASEPEEGHGDGHGG